MYSSKFLNNYKIIIILSILNVKLFNKYIVELKMKKLVVSIIFLFTLLTQLNAYNIGGEYATLINCQWGQYGYQYGNIGTYKTARGQIYQIFFGQNYCQN
jgi:hypothetical protein